MHILKHLVYDFFALIAFVVVIFCLQDAFLADLPDVVTIFLPCILWLLGLYFFDKMSPRSKNVLLNFLILLFIAGFFASFSDILKYLGYTAFCALYIFLITTLKVQNAKKSEKTVLPAKKGRGTLPHKAPPELEIDITPATAWKIVAFIFICIPYCILYVLQGFMSHAPQLWPLPIVLILSGCVLFMSGKRKYLSFLALCLFSITIDLSGLKGAQGYGRTLVVSPLLIIFWGLYLAPGAFRSIVDILKSKKKLIKKGH